jgi:hypothetical protein
MNRLIRVIVFVGLFAAQTSAAAPAFEVASVRVNPNAGRGLGPGRGWGRFSFRGTA